MAKSSTSSSAAGGSTAAPAAPSAQAQGAAAASVSPVVPGAPSAGTTAATPTPRSTSPERTSLPVQTSDGVADYEAQILAALGGETDTPATPAKAAPKKKAAPVQTVDEDDEDEPDDTGDDTDTADLNQDAASDAYDPDGPILGDDDADADEDADPDADGEADADASAKASKLKKDNFKLREERRKLREELTAAQDALKAAKEQAVTAAAASGGLPEFTGYYAGVKTTEDLQAVVAKIDADLDYLEDHLDGYSFQDAQGNLIEVTAEDAKAYRRQAREAKRWAGEIEKLIQTHTERATTSQAVARKKYPFVFDPKSPHNARVLDLAKEHPGLAKDPARALALGRMVIGKLVESGEYQLVKRGKPIAKPADPAPATRRAAAPASPSAPQAPRPGQPEPKPDLESLAMALFEDVAN